MGVAHVAFAEDSTVSLQLLAHVATPIPTPRELVTSLSVLNNFVLASDLR